MSGISEEEETVSGDGVQELAFLLDEAAELIAMPDRIKDAARTAGKALMIQDKEIRRLRAELAKAMAIGGVNRCEGCKTALVAEPQFYCRDCRP